MFKKIKVTFLAFVSIFAAIIFTGCEDDEYTIGSAAPFVAATRPDGTKYYEDVSNVHDANEKVAVHRKRRSALQNTKNRIFVTGLEMKETLPAAMLYTDQRGRVKVYEPSPFLAIKKADFVDFVEKNDQTLWFKEAVSGFRAWITGNVANVAATASRDISLGQQATDRAQIGANVETTRILATPVVTDPEQVVNFAPSR